MPTTEFSHALKDPHQTFAYLFVGYFFYKAILLFLNKEEALDKQRSNKVMKIFQSTRLRHLIRSMRL